MGSVITFDSFDHIGFIVKDMKAAAESWSAKLGVGDWKFIPGDVVGQAHVFSDTVHYELLEPAEGVDSLWATFLKERGEGLHHICHRVESVEEAVEKLVADGGVHMTPPNKYFAYVEIGGPGSTIIELLRTKDKR